jgi:hypothetical protein
MIHTRSPKTTAARAKGWTCSFAMAEGLLLSLRIKEVVSLSLNNDQLKTPIVMNVRIWLLPKNLVTSLTAGIPWVT